MTIGGVRSRICREVFQRLLPEQGAALVGILYENRFVLKVPVWNPSSGLSEDKPVILDPLDPYTASILVADAFGLDCDDLFQRFHQQWGILKNSPTVSHMRSRIGGHKLVGRLECCSPLD